MASSAASVLLNRAVKLQQDKRYTDALVCYQEGLDVLINTLKETKDEKVKTSLRDATAQWMERAERLKSYVQTEKEAGRYHHQVHIADNSINNSYQQIFGYYLDENVTSVEVEDPYIRSTHQIYNFLRFCELLVKKCTSLKSIILTTSLENGSNVQQEQHLQEIKQSLSGYNVELIVNYSPSLHDREFRLDNGWVVKIGRGLDYFKPEKKFSIGYLDYDLRKCHETTVDVFHKKYAK